MSTHKAGGKASQHVSPAGKRLGPKVSDGEKVSAGFVLMRQNGTKFSAGKNVKVARDHSLFASVSGVVKFGQKLGKKVVSVIS